MFTPQLCYHKTAQDEIKKTGGFPRRASGGKPVNKRIGFRPMPHTGTRPVGNLCGFVRICGFFHAVLRRGNRLYYRSLSIRRKTGNHLGRKTYRLDAPLLVCIFGFVPASRLLSGIPVASAERARGRFHSVRTSTHGECKNKDETKKIPLARGAEFWYNIRHQKTKEE